MTDTHDKLFAAPLDRVSDFDFGIETARVFDDMLGRSVPFYDEIQRMLVELAASFLEEGSRVVDLGCSTATTLVELARSQAGRSVALIGVDNSRAMLSQAREKLDEAGLGGRIELRHGDLDSPDTLPDEVDVFILNLTLQFVRPLRREEVLRALAERLNPGGVLLLVEKVLAEHSVFNRLYIELYHDYKRRAGYSEMEIAQKREALENVLVPYRLSENQEMLARAGFRDIDVFFRWYNFAGLVALKG